MCTVSVISFANYWTNMHLTSAFVYNIHTFLESKKRPCTTVGRLL